MGQGRVPEFLWVFLVAPCGHGSSVPAVDFHMGNLNPAGLGSRCFRIIAASVTLPQSLRGRGGHLCRRIRGIDERSLAPPRPRASPGLALGCCRGPPGVGRPGAGGPLLPRSLSSLRRSSLSSALVRFPSPPPPGGPCTGRLVHTRSCLANLVSPPEPCWLGVRAVGSTGRGWGGSLFRRRFVVVFVAAFPPPRRRLRRRRRRRRCFLHARAPRALNA